MQEQFLGSQFNEILKYRQAFKLTFTTLVALTGTESMDKSNKILLSEDVDVQKKTVQKLQVQLVSVLGNNVCTSITVSHCMIHAFTYVWENNCIQTKTLIYLYPM